MENTGKYIYCIIRTEQERNFGNIGIGGGTGGGDNEITTIGLGDLAMVVSDSPLGKYPVSRENLLAHQKVVEEVMKDFTLLPVRFCTIAPAAVNIRNLLERRRKEFRTLLGQMDFKIELGVKAIWRDMDSIFREIAEGDRRIASLRRKISGDGRTGVQAKMELGRTVERALAEKKEAEAGAIISVLRRASFDWKPGRVSDDKMVMNASFLVDKAREREFDSLVEDFSENYKERIRFMYAGPLPPYNFVSVTIHPEEWEI
ncbi:MAG: GvpL/GvpF family gas vesicle protein [Nitrospiraceae bacterium]|nr:GvpL/GvpF family gas vesicle protein [Nitrospiraceae bacterium]